MGCEESVQYKFIRYRPHLYDIVPLSRINLGRWRDQGKTPARGWLESTKVWLQEVVTVGERVQNGARVESRNFFEHCRGEYAPRRRHCEG